MKKRELFPLLLLLAAVLCAASMTVWAGEGPAITLLGDQELEWLCGVPFHDPGWTAVGPNGSDRTADVTVSGEVTAWRVGDYELCYTLADGEETPAEAKRTVHIVPQTLPDTVQPPAGTICLTFDDGPCPYTEQVLETLAKYNVKATFFIIANQTRYLDFLPRIVEEGHTLGIHCYDHLGLGYLYENAEHYFTDLMTAQEIVYEKTGQYAHVVRFPGGGWTASPLARSLGGYDALFDMMHDAGVREYDWNVQPESSTKTSEGTIMEFTHPREPYEYAVVLQHDSRLFSFAALESMIQWALDQGYTFAPLDPSFPEIHQ